MLPSSYRKVAMITVVRFAEVVATVIGIAGISILICGTIAATVDFVVVRGFTFTERYHRYRRNLGRAILLGLDFLVAADIVGTVAVEPSLQNVLILGGIVISRTMLSFALETEISGRVPWARATTPAES